jgi:signal transduction histidine kinase
MFELRMQYLVLPILAVGAIAAIVRYRRSVDATTQRGRRRKLAWSAALLLLSLVVLSTLYTPLERNGLKWLGVLIPLAAAIVVILRPSRAAQLVPPLLVGYGLAGFVVARDYLYGGVNSYGLGMVAGPGPESHLILPQAYLSLLLGFWLMWRALPAAPSAGRRLLGRAADLPPRGQLLALLLLPVVAAAAALATPELWLSARLGTVWTALLVTGAVTLVRRRPELAAKVAVAGIAALGLAGLGYALYGGTHIYTYSPGYWDTMYGPLLITGQKTVDAAGFVGVGFLGLAAWLAPQASPRVRRMLRMAPDAELLTRVQRLTESRADAVDTASADLRRLERDLHDGAQARLVALGMSLRAAERLIPTNPEAAIALVAEARKTSARALTELRELVRGVLPPVLADRGLADAVRALALDSPLAVQTAIDLPGRLPAPVETACYFAVAEILTNAAKHSGARDARVSMSHADGMLRIEVTDFGLGGADPARGTGLAGVEKRLATFDGILVVSSPIGGPTIVVMEVPCALSLPKISSS